jgi:hypothetical protein
MSDDPQTDARAEGYSWDQINDHVAQSTIEATNQGYSQDEIDQHLGYKDQTNFQERATANWAAHFQANPDALAALASPEPSLDLATPQTARDYADALSNREVKGPQDFSEQRSRRRTTFMAYGKRTSTRSYKQRGRRLPIWPINFRTRRT